MIPAIMKSYSDFHDFYLIKAVEFSGVYEDFMISGARTPHGLGSDDSQMESASQKPKGSRRLSRREMRLSRQAAPF
jgi:hypothetical protein